MMKMINLQELEISIIKITQPIRISKYKDIDIYVAKYQIRQSSNSRSSAGKSYDYQLNQSGLYLLNIEFVFGF